MKDTPNRKKFVPVNRPSPSAFAVLLLIFGGASVAPVAKMSGNDPSATVQEQQTNPYSVAETEELISVPVDIWQVKQSPTPPLNHRHRDDASRAATM